KPSRQDKSELLDSYELEADDVVAKVEIRRYEKEYVPLYILSRKEVSIALKAILETIKEELIHEIDLSVREFIDPSAYDRVKEKFRNKILTLMEKYLPYMDEKEKRYLSGILLHEMLGLEDIELLLNDANLEEIVVNGHKEPVWVYHKRFGWVKTNIWIESEEKIYNFASSIGRRVGRQITNLNPLMDAHLPTGDRVNATLFPISTEGNTLTIRKFSRSPWTIIHFIEHKTLSKEVAAFLWMAIQYEMNILVAGGTASGKTSMLNVLMPFMPANHRIISIEDTREINLPSFLHWVPFSSREANAEGKGAVTMLDLLVNSLRMRPDRIIIGEIRRKKEAEVMFEAIRTGHSAYATFHGDKAEEVFKRLINPPMDLPPSVLSALHLIVVQFRHRRLGIRRTLEVAEIIPADEKSTFNIIYRWNAKDDKIERINKSYRIYEDIHLYTGMSEEEIEKELQTKIKILEWMQRNRIKTINSVGKVVAEYYRDESYLMRFVNKPKLAEADLQELLGDDIFKELQEYWSKEGAS
ncbi:MAG: CpaF family protein, partial [Candidatus Nanohaloarchaeota archaeon]|nr:CpaF family protein [Candidatus Nanohaloarchaeota archaeon]